MLRGDMGFDINNNYATIEVPHNISEVTDNFDKEPFLSPRRAKAREVAISKGFMNEIHFENWKWFNSLENSQFHGYEIDILNYCNGGESE